MSNNNNSRRDFLKFSGALALGAFVFKNVDAEAFKKRKKIGLQLYSVRKEMLNDAAGTLKLLADMGYKEIESAKSQKGNYYGLKPAEIKSITKDLGITLVSGHVQIDKNFQASIDEAAEAGQDYLICSVLPTRGQTVDNYKKSAEIFMTSAEQCKKAGVKFGYHNHASEYEKEGGQILYDVLLDNTDGKLVHMELDLGWVIAAGMDPQYYFDKYPGRFPLWHLKDMSKATKSSVEFGKGDVDIAKMFANAKKSGMKHFFVEQEEYAHTALESCKEDIDYVTKFLDGNR